MRSGDKNGFIRFTLNAESYGVKGIRVTKQQEILPALQEAKETKNCPTLIEFLIEREEDVLPMVPPGNSLKDMILEMEEEKE